MKKILLLVTCFLFFAGRILSQELLLNDRLAPDMHPTQKNSPAANVPAPKAATLTLPFFDDFSAGIYLPDTTKWVWVDSGKPMPVISIKKGVRPPSKGVATFDGATFYGKKYMQTLANGYADSLFSQNIDLSPFQTGDSLFISFFLEPAGLGDQPEHSDSFFLDLATDTLGHYRRVFAVPGDSFPKDRFTQVILPLDTSAYFFDRFNFRFYSWGSLNGEMDVWHLDYVVLGSGRNSTDTLFSDHSVVQTSVRPIMGKYSALPWFMTQYWTTWDGFFIETAQLGTGTNTALVKGHLENPEPLNSQPLTGAVATAVTPSYTDQDFSTDSLPAFAPQVFTAPAILRMTIKANYTGTQTNTANDLIVLDYNCDSTMGYDDGEADAGYGLNSARSFAQRYILPDTLHDTLSAVWINFVPSLFYNTTTGVSTSTEGRSFKMGIWNDSGGLPDTLITIVLAGMNIDYGSSLNQYVRYPLTSKQKLPQQFYVGIFQNDQIPVGVGMDMNTDHLSEIYFQNSSLNWVNSSYKGTLMIRPEFYTAMETVSRDNEFESARDHFRIWPNPVNDGAFSIRPEDAQSVFSEIKLVDVTGRQTGFESESIGDGTVRIRLGDQVPSGIYFLQTTLSSKGNSAHFTNRIIVQKN